MHRSRTGETRRWAAGWPPGARAGLTALAATLLAAGGAHAQCTTANTVTANVVALDQPIFYNRLGAQDPHAMIFALRGDVVPSSGSTLSPGNVRLRPGKRPRPLTLRVQAGGCLTINFTNLLTPSALSNQPAVRDASLHVMGMQLVSSIADDGSFVGQNASSLVAPGGSRTYRLYAEKEGTFLLYSTGSTTGGDGDGGQITKGLFGAVNVEPAGSEWYRSQVTAEDMALAQKKTGGVPVTTPGGHPVIDYDAVYPSTHPLAGRTILKMVQNGVLVHADLTAIIAGPNKGLIPTQYDSVHVARGRHRPFREMTIIFHDEVGLVQAFNPIFEDPRLEFTLHSGRDAFSINYGTGGIGAEVIANRLGVGPMWDCNECKYEEFFLSSWAVGDPAMVVDVPADVDANNDGRPDPGRKATKAFFPDDPSNVYHSYMNDHLKIRNLHAGPKEHHIFHLHAHQWLHTPNSDNSSYLDSQAIGPGGGYTYEITYDGSSNRNKTVGDAIFHCHFYPHFAQGMWALWRVHDVFEKGTALDADGTPAAGARALPDGEIAEGTPIPGLVPLPTYALAPMPTGTEPGYPFFVPGVAGHRPPKPPLDTEFDGGLKRHVVRDGTASFPDLNRLDFHKDNVTLVADTLPETGTALERAAMAFHARRSQPSYRFDPLTFSVVSDTFLTNGRPGVAGAPFADPCIDDLGRPRGTPRTYKAAGIQLDAKYNKARWHFPQHRMFSLWTDVDSFISGVRPPEPFFFRANTDDCITYHLVNLIPKNYEMDDFQVKTPTDVIGQHIHLVKFDVTASDGAGNGFNYEDGSFSPGETQERVEAIRRQNGCTGVKSGDARDGTWICPVAKPHPFFGNGPGGAWVGAQETIQRWFVDDVLNVQGKDRTLRTVFTHDHFGPSTHQQAGLYAGLVTEPKNSSWRDPETGVTFGTRADGGPTSWRADILTANPDSSYREFNLQIADFALAYDAGSNHTPRTFTDPDFSVSVLGIADPAKAINPAGKFEPNPVLPFMLRPPVAGACPSGVPAPCPELLSADDPGTMLVNYRNEPLALRVRDPANNTQATGNAGDLSLAFASDVNRKDARFNAVGPYRPLTGGVAPGDPFTPLIRVYEDDRMQVRLLVGAHEEGHNFSIHGMEWLFEPSDSSSGYRNSQMAGISEHHEFVLPPLPDNIDGMHADWLYMGGAATDDLWNGLWGIIRSYRKVQNGLLTLPSNPYPSKSLRWAEQEHGGGGNLSISSATSRFPVAGQGSRLGQRGRVAGGRGASLAMTGATEERYQDPCYDVYCEPAGCYYDPYTGTNRCTTDPCYDPRTGMHTLCECPDCGTDVPEPTQEPVEAQFEVISAADTTAWYGDAYEPITAPDGGYGDVVTPGDYTTGVVVEPYTSPTTDEPVLEPTPTEPCTTTSTGGTTTSPTYKSFCLDDGTSPTSPTYSRLSAAFRGTGGGTVAATGSPLLSGGGGNSGKGSYDKKASRNGGEDFRGVCPKWADKREFDITAVAASTALPGGRIVYNSRTVNGGPLHDPSGIMYVYTSDLDSQDRLKAGVPVEPLVLRARAGECIYLKLRNRLPQTLQDPDGFNTLPMIVDRFNANQVDPSDIVGLHPQLVAFDPTRSDGSQVGFNPRTVVKRGQSIEYQWFAGEVAVENGQLVAYGVEYGATNLMPSDRIKHPNKGAIAALVIEPADAKWDRRARAQTTILKADSVTPYFREQVLLFQDDVNLRFGSTVTLKLRDCSDTEDMEPAEVARCAANPAGDTTFAINSAVPNLAEAEDPEDSGQKGLNYRTEPLWFRMGYAPNASLGFTRDLAALKNALSNGQVGGDPQTPVVLARPGANVRLRVLEPGGHARNHVFQVHGHQWEELPYGPKSRELAPNPKSERKGSRIGHGPSDHFDVVLKNGAGGKNRVPGDYLYRDQSSFLFDGGIWGLLRVTTSAPASLSGETTPLQGVKPKAGRPAGAGAARPAEPLRRPAADCVVDPTTAEVRCGAGKK